MGKLVVSEFISLDGVMEDPGGGEEYEHGGWTFKFDRGEGDRFKFDELKAADVQLLGHVTYQAFASAWPTMQGTGAFGEKMNAMPKYVVSSTLGEQDAAWQPATVLGGGENLAAEVGRLKEQVQGDILVAGSAQLVQSLAREDLVDEYRLMVFPIVLGSGKRLFGEDVPPTPLRLLDSKAVGSDGVFILTYEPKR
jgi:dihydrofolate reductase